MLCRLIQLVCSRLRASEQVPVADLAVNRTILKADGRTLKAKDGLMVKNKSGTWRRAVIQKAPGKHWLSGRHRGEVKVHYIGLAHSLDAWLPRESLRIGWRICLTAFDEEKDLGGRW
eukprot:COSAG02_NODE_289_length_25587_cov_34.270323_12_plen_117_part_00